MPNETYVSDIQVGDVFHVTKENGGLVKNNDLFIKTNMIHSETGDRYCCNINTGVMYIFDEDNTEVSVMNFIQLY